MFESTGSTTDVSSEVHFERKLGGEIRKPRFCSGLNVTQQISRVETCNGRDMLQTSQGMALWVHGVDQEYNRMDVLKPADVERLWKARLCQPSKSFRGSTASS